MIDAVTELFLPEAIEPANELIILLKRCDGENGGIVAMLPGEPPHSDLRLRDGLNLAA